MGKIGITTTVPVEAIFAAGHVPVDLNNLFISDPNPRKLLEFAEKAGLPSTTCSWIKGLYAVAKTSDLEGVVGVLGGDCSNTKALVEIWNHEGVRTIPFAYPYERDHARLAEEISHLCKRLGTSFEAAEGQRERLAPARALAAEIDRLTWEENRVTGFENHLYLVSASDFNSDPEGYEAWAGEFIAMARGRQSLPGGLRLGYIGVPTIIAGFYEFLEERGARVVFNETQRQFSMPNAELDLVESYLAFTYPYDVSARIEDIRREVARRGIDGVIHYVQSFCFRQMEDMLLRKALGVPVLTIEGDRPEPLDGRTRTRLESFLEML